MEKTTTILLVLCVVLVAALSLTVGLLIGNQNNNHMVVNTTNNTTAAANNTTNQTQTEKTSTTKKTSSNGKITANQAANIALKSVGDGWSVMYVDYETSPTYVAPCYQVGVRNPDTHVSQDVYVNAQTGSIMLNPQG
ncbi:PepSY domain-containing protein [Methanobacterium congolense]|uniref:Region of a membrane-bound protein predicted to be embedded in the membrane n=1 Tax=Methanobacterium congolense TaxID=118062 RepID=A0A1D3L2W4_9EURY|nr:PepSY domain-containing protein [Methanobacterium congolense]SCG85951.1 Region of a membrane-bound protein predicted to be embedded in the membrane [Methanobacterium congolense]